MQWRFIDTGENTGEFNMQFDESLAKGLLDGSGMPTVRFFLWKPWAISLGFNQDETKIDYTRCSADGVDVVRRPTGGRAVFHAEELTYSVVMHSGDLGVLEIYNTISKALVRGLQLYGVEAMLSKSQPDLRGHYRTLSSIPCFTASARYEIEWEGRKLVGSAQRRFRNHERGTEVVLQHGSILTGSAHKRLVDYLDLPDGESRKALVRELDERTTDIPQITGREVNMRELAACMKTGFEEAWQIQFSAPEQLEHICDNYV